jgi:hypothetical protein
VKRAVERERDELRKMRQQIRDQRKEQAAHNVKVAAEMYGGKTYRFPLRESLPNLLFPPLSSSRSSIFFVCSDSSS